MATTKRFVCRPARTTKNVADLLRASKRTTTTTTKKSPPKRPNVADLLRARMERERKLCAKTPAAPLTEKLSHINVAADLLGLSVWTLRHWANEGRLNYRRIGRRLYVTETEIARIARNDVRAVNAA